MNSSLFVGLLPELVAGVAVFALGGVVARVTRKRRVLEWSTARWTLISGSHLRDRVKISFDGKPVDYVWVTAVDLVNVGNDAVLPAHFVEPIRLVVGGGVQVLDVTLSGEAEGNGQVERVANELLMAPRLFNPGDTLRITILTDGEVDDELYVRAENTVLKWKKTSQLAPGARSEGIRTLGILIATFMVAMIVTAQIQNDDVGTDTLLMIVALVGLILVQALLVFVRRDSGRQ